jgi:hypothetical protein
MSMESLNKLKSILLEIPPDRLYSGLTLNTYIFVFTINFECISLID